MAGAGRTHERVERVPLIPMGSGGVPALVAIIRRLSVARSLQEIMETVTHPARTLLGAGGVTFVLREGDHCHYAEEDAISPLWKGKRFPLNACISGWCIKERRAVAIYDIYQDPRIPQDAYRPTFVRSLAMVPLPQEEPIAAMGAYWDRVREISVEEVELLQTIANSAALALANAELRRERARSGEQSREFTHRIKNVFAITQALAYQTDGESAEEYRSALLGRLRSLEQAHAELLNAETGSADMEALLDVLLTPLISERGATRDFSGPQVALPGHTAAALALVIHELGTNALKHGALSAPTGHVSVTWDRPGDSRLVISWKETGGPAVEAPGETGLGTRLIESIVQHQMDGRLTRRYEADGFFCELAISVSD